MKKLFILFIAVAMVAAFTVPAMADAEWNFYGSARMATFSVDDDPDTPGVDSDTDTQWAQQGNSRIGATVKFNDEIGGGFEMSDSFGKRKLYGTYNFGAGQLLLGQTYTPSANFYSNSVYDGDGDLLGVGEYYGGRLQMIQLKFGGFKIALIKNAATGAVYEQTAAVPVDVSGGINPVAAVNYDVDVTIPKIEASFRFATDMFHVKVFGGYQTFELESNVPGEVDPDDIDSLLYGVGAGVNFGPAYVKASVTAGQNLGDYGAYNPHGVNAGANGGTAPGEVEDNDALGYLLVVGFKAGDAATIEAGYGYQEYDSNLAGEQADETTQMYVNATINITKGFFIVPEIGIIDRDESATSGDDQGDITYFGAKWQINF
ncbi:MAG: porin [Deltaproteobacteria bacterium]|nr:porin [Deltaproteobacteria bacterium]